MAFHNPKGRVNYEPNSWTDAPREDPQRGFRSVPAPVAGPRVRERDERFADHYSQARQFFLSQTGIEQAHIRDAYVFELSKVETRAIRERMVAHLVHVDPDLAQGVAARLGLPDLPTPPDPARPVVALAPSPALSILSNAAGSFTGRKLGILVGDAADAAILDGLVAAAEAAGARAELVAPRIGGITDSAGALRRADHMIDGGPSVLFDAVALVVAEAAPLAGKPAVRDFLADAFAHAKFIAFTVAAQPLLDRAGVTPDDGCVLLDNSEAAQGFLDLCAALRHWPREATRLGTGL